MLFGRLKYSEDSRPPAPGCSGQVKTNSDVGLPKSTIYPRVGRCGDFLHTTRCTVHLSRSSGCVKNLWRWPPENHKTIPGWDSETILCNLSGPKNSLTIPPNSLHHENSPLKKRVCCSHCIWPSRSAGEFPLWKQSLSKNSKSAPLYCYLCAF